MSGVGRDSMLYWIWVASSRGSSTKRLRYVRESLSAGGGEVSDLRVSDRIPSVPQPEAGLRNALPRVVPRQQCNEDDQVISAKYSMLVITRTFLRNIRPSN